MKLLDKIFRKRLKRIREELDSYIEVHLTVSKPVIYAQTLGSISQEKRKSSVQEKFLGSMKLSDAEDEFFASDSFDEKADKRVQVSERKFEPKKKVRDEGFASIPSRTLSKSYAPMRSGEVRFEEFIKKEREWPELDKVLARKEESFSKMLLRMIDEKGLKDSDVYKRANIDRRLFSKIRGDEAYVPSKKTAISFCLALQLELEEAKKLLATAGYTLSNSFKFDLIIMYLIENKEYSIHFANIVLDDYGEGTLSK